MSSKRILIVGAGGLGVPAALALARAGVREITVADPDPVELSNLARQVIFRSGDIGKPKVDAVASRLRERFGEPVVDARRLELNSADAAELIGAHGFVIDATDNPAAKFLINDACVAARRPFVYAGVVGLIGQAMTILPGETACLRCLFEEPPDEAVTASCREAGILGPVAGAIGELQAVEAIRWLSGRRPELAGRILAYDARFVGKTRITRVEPRSGCECGAGRDAAPERTAITSRER